jgi:hypothetical protein
MAKAIICSIPKSGTYLVGAILQRLGLRDTRQHLHLRGFTDYNNVDLETARRKPDELSVTEPLEATLRRIASGEFAVGHLPSNMAPLLGDFKVIFVYRNIRDILVSFCRWTADTGRWTDDGAWRRLPEGPERLLGFMRTHRKNLRKWIAAAATWKSEPSITQVSFEELMGDDGSAGAAAAMRRIARALEVGPFTDAELLEHLAQAKETETITRSAARSKRESYWNEAVEREFVRCGFAAINTRLGFDEPSARRLWGRWWSLKHAAESVRWHRPAA